jgi:hypothetical protein
VPLALSTGHKLGLGIVAAIFIGFALASALLVPRYRPQFPGNRGLAAFIVVTIVLFGAMMTAVQVFGAEEEEGHEPAATQTTPEEEGSGE